MAAIDKTYVTVDQYHQLKDWAKDKICVLHNGYKSSVKNWICEWNDEDFHDSVWNDDTLPCWNTGSWQDRWLYQNCPLDFIQNRLHEQYSEDGLKELIAPIPERTNIAKHFKIIKKPQFNYKTRHYWGIQVKSIKWWYNDELDYWTCYNEFLPWNTNTANIKKFNLKKLYRKIIKWKLPVGTIINIYGRYLGQYYQIKLTK